MSRPTIQNGQEPLVLKKTVVFRPASTTDTVKEGYALFYNYDSVKDWEGNTATQNTFSRTAVSFAEGSQDFNARYLEVEKGSSGNVLNFAGFVACGHNDAGNGDIIEILVPVEGAVIPVYTDLSVTNNATILAVRSGSYFATNPVYGGSAAPSRIIGIAVETIDRSSDNGLTWMRFTNGLSVGPGATSNQLIVGESASSGELIPYMISVKTIQTGGTFNALRIRGELNGADSGTGEGGGIIRLEGVVNSTSIASTSAVSTHLVFKTGATADSGATFTGLYCKVENQDSTPAALASNEVAAARFVTQLNEDPGTHSQLIFETEGSDKPDYWFTAKDANAVTFAAKSSAAVSHIIKIEVAGTDYWIMVSNQA